MDYKVKDMAKGQRDPFLVPLPLVNDRCTPLLYGSTDRARHGGGGQNQTKAERYQTFTATPAHPAFQSDIPVRDIRGSPRQAPRHWWQRSGAKARPRRCEYDPK